MRADSFMTSPNLPVKCSFLPPPPEDKDGVGMRITLIGINAPLLFLKYPNPANTPGGGGGSLTASLPFSLNAESLVSLSSNPYSWSFW